MVPLVKKLVQKVKMVMPLVPKVQMLPTNGTIGRTRTHTYLSTIGKNGTIGKNYERTQFL